MSSTATAVPEKPQSSVLGRRNPFPIVIGGLLVLAGVLLFLRPATIPIFDGNVFAVGWPFFVISLGLGLLLAHRSVPQHAEYIALSGGLMIAVGVFLAYQNATGNWEAWYWWPLAVLGGAGLGQVVYGFGERQMSKLRIGVYLVGIGVVLTIVGAGIEGAITTTMLAVALVVLGIVVVLFGLRPNQLEPGTG